MLLNYGKFRLIIKPSFHYCKIQTQEYYNHRIFFQMYVQKSFNSLGIGRRGTSPGG